MKHSISIGLVVVLAVGLFACPSYSDEDLVAKLHELNGRIEEAFAEGRTWAKYPGGLSAFLFGSESVVGPGVIYFPADSVLAERGKVWLRAYVYKSDQGPCLISGIEPCVQSDAQEFLDRRDFLRKSMNDRLGFTYSENGPLDLLNLLKTWDRKNYVSLSPQFGWIKETDIPSLVLLLDSTEPCANVQNVLSSYIDTTRSTVGNEAAYLIEGFRADRYPPRLNSTRPLCDIEEIKGWWKERSGT